MLLHMVWLEREFRMQVSNVLHAARWKCRTQKFANNSPSGHHRTSLSGYIFATKALIDNPKKLLNSDVSPICPHNTVNFGPLAAEICWLVWGTPENFNGFRVLAALLHGTRVVSVSQFAALNRGRHLHSTGRPSHWALAGTLVIIVIRLQARLKRNIGFTFECAPYAGFYRFPSAKFHEI